MQSYVRPWPSELPHHPRPRMPTLQRISETLYNALGTQDNFLPSPFLPVTTRQADSFKELNETGTRLSRIVQHPSRYSESTHNGAVLAYQRALTNLERDLARENNRVRNRRVPVASTPRNPDMFVPELMKARNSFPRFRISGPRILWDHQPIVRDYDQSFEMDLPVLTVILNTETIAADGLLASTTFRICNDYPTLPNYLSDYHYPHPHISDYGRQPCWGEARALAPALFQQGSILAPLLAIKSFLNTYASEPYVHLHEFSQRHPLTPSSADDDEADDDDDESWDEDEELDDDEDTDDSAFIAVEDFYRRDIILTTTREGLPISLVTTPHGDGVPYRLENVVRSGRDIVEFDLFLSLPHDEDRPDGWVDVTAPHSNMTIYRGHFVIFGYPHSQLGPRTLSAAGALIPGSAHAMGEFMAKALRYVTPGTRSFSDLRHAFPNTYTRLMEVTNATA